MKMDTINLDPGFVFDTRVNQMEQYSVSPTLSAGVDVRVPGYCVGGMTPVAGGKVTSPQPKIGMLTYAMYDTQIRYLVWSACGEQTFKMSDEIQTNIGAVTKKMFKNPPVK